MENKSELIIFHLLCHPFSTCSLVHAMCRFASFQMLVLTGQPCTAHPAHGERHLVGCPFAGVCRDVCFISKGFDASNHFEDTVQDVIDLYQCTSDLANSDVFSVLQV